MGLFEADSAERGIFLRRSDEAPQDHRFSTPTEIVQPLFHLDELLSHMRQKFVIDSFARLVAHNGIFKEISGLAGFANGALKITAICRSCNLLSHMRQKLGSLMRHWDGVDGKQSECFLRRSEIGAAVLPTGGFNHFPPSSILSVQPAGGLPALPVDRCPAARKMRNCP